MTNSRPRGCGIAIGRGGKVARGCAAGIVAPWATRVHCIRQGRNAPSRGMSSVPATSDVRPTALITGASVGIGKELAYCFAAGGHDLVLVARDREQLAGVAAECRARGSREAVVIAADLSDPAAPRA